MMTEEGNDIIELMQREFHSEFTGKLHEFFVELMSLPPYLLSKKQLQAWMTTLEIQGKKALLEKVNNEMQAYHFNLVPFPQDLFSVNVDACHVQELMHELLEKFSIKTIIKLFQALSRIR